MALDKTRPVLGRRIVQAPPEQSFCAGCSTCEIVCALTHDGVVGPCYNRIVMEKNVRTMFNTVRACAHCPNHPCYEACPKKGEAMKIDGDGVVYIEEKNCVGCGLCVKSCALAPPRINMVNSEDRSLRKAKKCDLCRNRKEGPACVQYCPVRCISVGV